MIEHLQILFFILLVLWNFWMVLFIKQVHKTYPQNYLKELITMIIVFLIFYILGFIRMYLLKNINEFLYIDWVSLIELIWYLLRIWVIYLFINILLSFRNKAFNKKQKKVVFTIALVIITSYTFRLFYPEVNKALIWSDYILDITEKHHQILKILVLFGFCFFWSPQIAKDKIKISRLFSLLFILAYGVSIIFVFINKNNRSFELSFVIFETLRFSFFLLAPLVWIRFIYLPYAQSLSKLIGQSSNFDYIFKKYNISQREKEIIVLIIDGKGNNEIKEKLFISYHTVKNHLSNIYRKLNISNRHELIHLFMKSKDI